MNGIDARKLGIVARFELAESLRSRLVVVVLAIYGAGAALGAHLFAMALQAAEGAVRESMLGSMSAHAIPDDLVRRQAMPRVISFFVEDEALRRELLNVDPIAIFYGLMALQLVAPLVLVTSGVAHASDIARGAVRFVLTRCDRTAWALGKMAGHAALLGLGLLAGALGTAAVAYGRGVSDAGSALWLLRAAFRAWLYGVTHLAIFTGLALAVRSAARSRAISVLALFALWIGHGATQSEWVLARAPAMAHLRWLFPAQYKLALWSPGWFESMVAMAALLTIGAVAFSIGRFFFRQADA